MNTQYSLSSLNVHLKAKLMHEILMVYSKANHHFIQA